MKKAVKIILGIGIAGCVLGAILIGVGVATGGTYYVQMTDLNHDSSWKHEELLEKTRLETFDSLKVSLDTADFQVKRSDDDYCYISYRVTSSKQKSTVKYGVKNGKLTIDQSDEDEYTVDISFLSQIFGERKLDGKNSTTGSKVTLYVPKNTSLRLVDIETETGNIDLKNCHIRQGDVDSDIGDITLDRCTFDNLEIESEMGDICVIGEKARLQKLHIRLQTENGYMDVDDALSVSKTTEDHHDADDHEHEDGYDDEGDTETYFVQAGTGGMLEIKTEGGDIQLSCR